MVVFVIRFFEILQRIPHDGIPSPSGDFTELSCLTDHLKQPDLYNHDSTVRNLQKKNLANLQRKNLSNVPKSYCTLREALCPSAGAGQCD
jgi:hypothetical protein